METLTALHASRDVLLSVMDVFLSDPLLDWLRAPSKFTRQTSGFCYVEGGRKGGREAYAAHPVCCIQAGINSRRMMLTMRLHLVPPRSPPRGQCLCVHELLVSSADTSLCAALCSLFDVGGHSELRRRLRNARRKLEHGNPASILIDDLKQNAAVRKLKFGPQVQAKDVQCSCFARLSTIHSHTRAHLTQPLQLFRVARGPSDGRRRAAENNVSVAGDDAGTRCANVTEQVECLVELATDPSMLVRQWVGLATWV